MVIVIRMHDVVSALTFAIVQYWPCMPNVLLFRAVDVWFLLLLDEQQRLVQLDDLAVKSMVPDNELCLDVLSS